MRIGRQFHTSDIRDRDEICVPAGRGATAFVDAVDVGAVAAAALLDPAGHRCRAWTITGPEALNYAQVAAILSQILGRPICYSRPVSCATCGMPIRSSACRGDGGRHQRDLYDGPTGIGR
jgi:nucleoside-diphosphate-sugar epimerase